MVLELTLFQGMYWNFEFYFLGLVQKYASVPTHAKAQTIVPFIIWNKDKSYDVNFTNPQSKLIIEKKCVSKVGKQLT